jgi:hypothetical protein
MTNATQSAGWLHKYGFADATAVGHLSVVDACDTPTKRGHRQITRHDHADTDTFAWTGQPLSYPLQQTVTGDVAQVRAGEHQPAGPAGGVSWIIAGLRRAQIPRQARPGALRQAGPPKALAAVPRGPR